jgi:hypothetical protein
MKHLFVILAIASLACVATPQASASKAVYADTQIEDEISTVVMTVIADEGLNIRAEHSEESADIGDLFPGDVVTCRELVTVGDSIWCHHERGWSNARWLEAR